MSMLTPLVLSETLQELLDSKAMEFLRCDYLAQQEKQYLNRKFLEVHQQEYNLSEKGYELHGFQKNALQITVECRERGYQIVVYKQMVGDDEPLELTTVFKLYGESLLSVEINVLLDAWGP